MGWCCRVTRKSDMHGRVAGYLKVVFFSSSSLSNLLQWATPAVKTLKRSTLRHIHLLKTVLTRINGSQRLKTRPMYAIDSTKHEYAIWLDTGNRFADWAHVQSSCQCTQEQTTGIRYISTLKDQVDWSYLFSFILHPMPSLYKSNGSENNCAARVTTHVFHLLISSQQKSTYIIDIK